MSLQTKCLLISKAHFLADPMNTFVCQSHINPEENPPMRLSYHGNVHYNSIVDPYAPTVGVGLGIAGYKPGVRFCIILSIIFYVNHECRQENTVKPTYKNLWLANQT